jgi:hypothetical protein
VGELRFAWGPYLGLDLAGQGAVGNRILSASHNVFSARSSGDRRGFVYLDSILHRARWAGSQRGLVDGGRRWLHRRFVGRKPFFDFGFALLGHCVTASSERG